MTPERKLISERLKGALETNPAWATIPAETQACWVRRIERSCLNCAIDKSIADGVNRQWQDKRFRDRYSQETSRIIAHLDLDSAVGSDHLFNLLLAGRADLNKVAEMTNYELCPEASREVREEIALRQQQKIDVKVSNMYRCGKCGGRETIPIEYQARSGDEQSTISHKCINCGFVWRT